MRRAALLALAVSSFACASAASSGSVFGGPARPGKRPPSPPTDFVAVSRALTEIDAAERQGNLEDEMRWAQSAEATPEDPAAQFLAVAAQPEGDDRWSGYRDLSLDFQRSCLPWVGMGRIYVGWRTWDQAEKAVLAALEREPGCFLAVRVRAEMDEARGRLDAAEKGFTAVLAADPHDPEAHFGLARLARQKGDLEAAHAHAAAALETARTLPGAWALLGDLSLELGEPAMAIDFWKGAVAQAPRDRAARVSLARLLVAQGDQAGAREQWQAAVELKEDAESLAALSDAAHASGDAATEQKALERLTQLKPSPAQWRRVAEVRVAAGDLTGAERAYRRALDGGPRDPQTNLGLAKVYLTRGEAQPAVEALRAAGPAGQADLTALEKTLNLARLAKLDMNGLQRAVQALVDKTYRTRLAETPSLAGTIRVRVTVDAAGTASLVELLEDSIHDPDVRACAYWNLRDATYPTERPGRYSFSFSFRK
jgi:tetratricopeptide (TPR) repeat protein